MRQFDIRPFLSQLHKLSQEKTYEKQVDKQIDARKSFGEYIKNDVVEEYEKGSRNNLDPGPAMVTTTGFKHFFGISWQNYNQEV